MGSDYSPHLRPRQGQRLHQGFRQVVDLAPVRGVGDEHPHLRLGLTEQLLLLTGGRDTMVVLQVINGIGLTQLTWAESNVHTAFDERAQSFRY